MGQVAEHQTGSDCKWVDLGTVGSGCKTGRAGHCRVRSVAVAVRIAAKMSDYNDTGSRERDREAAHSRSRSDVKHVRVWK